MDTLGFLAECKTVLVQVWQIAGLTRPMTWRPRSKTYHQGQGLRTFVLEDTSRTRTKAKDNNSARRTWHQDCLYRVHRNLFIPVK